MKPDTEPKDEHWGEFNRTLEVQPSGSIALLVTGAPMLYKAEMSVSSHPSDPELFSVVLIISNVQTVLGREIGQLRIRLAGSLLSHIKENSSSDFLSLPYVLPLPSNFFGELTFPDQKV
jgi:hypothetical protein